MADNTLKLTGIYPIPALRIDKFVADQGWILTNADPENGTITVKDPSTVSEDDPKFILAAGGTLGPGGKPMTSGLSPEAINQIKYNLADEKVLQIDKIAQTDPKYAEMAKKPYRVQVNNPEMAIPVSQESVLERAKEAFTNTSGSGLVKYLQNKYGKDNVAVSENKGIVTKRPDGVWTQQDPSIWNGDPWKASEMIKDLVGLAPAIPSMITQGAALLAPATGGTSLLLGAAAGGVGYAAKSMLGKALGVYEANSNEVIKDVALEMSLGLANQWLALGQRATPQFLNKGFSSLQKIPENMKNLFGQFYDTATKSEAGTFATTVENSPKVFKQLDILRQASAANGSKIFDESLTSQGQILNKFLTESDDTLKRNYVNNLTKLLNSPEANKAVVNPKAIQAEFRGALENAGLGTIEKGKFIPISDAALAARADALGPQAAGSALSEDQIKALSGYVQRFNHLFLQSPKEGRAAAEWVMKFKEEARAISKDLYAKSLSPQDTQRITQVYNVTHDVVNNQLEKTGLLDQVKALDSQYIQASGAIDDGRKILSNGKEITRANQINKENLAGYNTRKLITDLKFLNPESADETLKKINIIKAAASMDNVVGRAGYTAKSIAARALRPVVSAITPSAETVASRELVKKLYPIKTWMQNQSKPVLNQILSDENALKSFLITIEQATQGPEKMSQQMLDAVNQKVPLKP